jgi:hypothetical protein
MLRLFSSGQINPDLQFAQRLLNWLHARAEPLILLPDIYQRGLNAIGDQRTARKFVGILEDHKWLVKVDGGAIVGGHNRREAWWIVRRGS